jgi:hypothetical protein
MSPLFIERVNRTYEYNAVLVDVNTVVRCLSVVRCGCNFARCAPTISTVYSLQSTVYSLQSTVYSLQSTVYSLQSTVYSTSALLTVDTSLLVDRVCRCCDLENGTDTVLVRHDARPLC